MNTLIARVARPFPSLRQNWFALPLRLVIGYGFMVHGYLKLMRGPEVFTRALEGLGIPYPELMSWLTILFEFLTGFAVLIGALIPLATIPMVVILLVAIVTVHLPFGFSAIKLISVDARGPQFGKPGYETDLLYLAGLAALVIGGSGPFSVDNLIVRKFGKPERL